ncbi:MAG: cupin domain-containing protein [Alphaproteobacteria bacterium]|nr:cupin domain-containing protein [Alphaproteobacteria bacterium]
MSSQATATAETTEGQDYVVARKSDPNYVKGRREFFKYVDLGVTNGSQGRMRVQKTSATAGLSEPTGWHYHKCEGQFVYMLDGWLELQFDDGKTIRLEEGDSVYIPGFAPHNEIRTSDEFELLEFSVPADMGTEVCDPPAS